MVPRRLRSFLRLTRAYLQRRSGGKNEEEAKTGGDGLPFLINMVLSLGFSFIHSADGP